MRQMYDKAIDFLRDKLNASVVIDEVEKRYRFEHSLRVASIAQEIAEKEGQDVLITTLAAILHDVGKFDTEINEDHGRVSADVARPFLGTLGISQKQEDDIHYCIAVHVDGEAGYDYENIGEAETVSDADNIDRFGVYRIYQTLRWDGIDTMSAEEAIKKYIARIGRLQKYRDDPGLFTPTANRMFCKNLGIQIDFYRDLIEELRRTGLPYASLA
ncbi:MAG: HD domain-containing protein [Clostridia bacterium]|nr:HD domain-containing protein [Clostridia bacterium]